MTYEDIKMLLTAPKDLDDAKEHIKRDPMAMVQIAGTAGILAVISILVKAGITTDDEVSGLIEEYKEYLIEKNAEALLRKGKEDGPEDIH